MGALLRKGLVIKYSNPAKFFLTENGQALAERLEEAENGNGGSSVASPAVNFHARGSYSTGNVLGSGFSSKSSTANSGIPGSQVFDTGDSDLDAALNASLVVNSQSDHNRLHNWDNGSEDFEFQTALNKSLEIRNHRIEAQIGVLGDDSDDADLKEALKASMEVGSEKGASDSKSYADTYNGLCPQRQPGKNDFSVELEDTDLEAALKASLETCSPQASLPNKHRESPVHVKKDSAFTSEATPIPNISHLARDVSDNDDVSEDEDIKRAIAESLLSYSQELSTSQCSLTDPAGDDVQVLSPSSKVTNEQIDLPTSTNLNTSADNSIFVVSDDDDNDSTNVNAVLKEEVTSGSPLKSVRRFHEVSPSPSPPPCPLPNMSSSPTTTTKIKPRIPDCLFLSSRTSSTSVVQEQSKSTRSLKFLKRKQSIFSSSLGVSNECEGGVITITDDDVDKNKKCKNNLSESISVSAMDSDDELPDLDVPLFQRLLNKGKIQSNLLMESAASKKHLLSAAKSSDSIDSSLNNDVKDLKGTQVMAIKTDFENSQKASTSSESTSSFHIEASSSLSSSATLIRNSCSKKEGTILLDRPTTCAKSISQSIPNHIKTNHSGVTISATASSLSEKSVPACNTIFTLQPGSFDIILCLDNREFYGSKSSCKTLLPDLLKSGVQCDLRLLHVGDLLWIARERVGPQID
ncbi:crossover junction endonuclease MUS81, partial [Elysia marginata]